VPAVADVVAEGETGFEFDPYAVSESLPVRTMPTPATAPTNDPANTSAMMLGHREVALGMPKSASC
jgi:hypothetical protein